MDEKLMHDMIKDLHEAIGYEAVPENALCLKEMVEISGLTEAPARRALSKLVDSGEWKKGRRGNKTFYWKVLS